MANSKVSLTFGPCIGATVQQTSGRAALVSGLKPMPKPEKAPDGTQRRHELWRFRSYREVGTMVEAIGSDPRALRYSKHL